LTELTRHQKVIIGVLVFVALFYAWTAATSYPFSFTGTSGTVVYNPYVYSYDIYNLMAKGLLHGHVYLPLQVPSGMLHLTNPYSPLQNARYQDEGYHDLIYYRGHFYSAWGPSPVLLFLLFKLIFLNVSQSFAVAVYSFIGYVCSVAVLHLLIRRFVPRAPNWLLLVATIGLALSNVLLYNLRRPAQYEVAISGAYCFEMIGLLLVVTAVLKPVRWRLKLAFGSLAMGLAVAARPTLLGGCFVPLAAGIYLAKQGHSWRAVLVNAVLPLVVCAALLGGYNQARFGSPGQFGAQDQLSMPSLPDPTSSPSYVAPGLFSYLLTPWHLEVGFPYVNLLTDAEYPFKLPATYAGGSDGWPTEPAGGMFPLMPVTLLLFAIPLLLWRKRDATEHVAAWIAAGLAAVGILIMLVLSEAILGPSQRYEVDYATYFMLAAFVIFAVLLSRWEYRRLLRRVTAVIGVVLTVIGAVLGTALGFSGQYNLLEEYHPGIFNLLADITSPLPTFATMLAGHPMIASVVGAGLTNLDSSYVQPPVDVGMGNFQECCATAAITQKPTTFTLISPSTRRYDLDAGITSFGWGPPHTDPSVRVRGPSGQRYLVRVPRQLNGDLSIPVYLHTGLNRVMITLDAAPVARPWFYLTNIRLTSN
jgi:hypothetical protein